MKKFDQLARFTGLSFTNEVSTPDYRHSPVLGPSKFSIRLKKEDENLQFYQAKLLYNNKGNHFAFISYFCSTPQCTMIPSQL